MRHKSALLLGTLLSIVIVSGCISEETGLPDLGTGCQHPKEMIGDVCCLDQNENDICDMEEAGCPSSCDDDNPCTDDACSSDTGFECVHNPIYPCCGNGVCDPEEDLSNTCPADCTILSITDFKYDGTPDFIEDSKYVFIHTSAAEVDYRLFYINITAGSTGMDNIRYTFKCNSTKHTNLDSIDSDATNVTNGTDIGKYNKLEDDYYEIYTFFFLEEAPTFRLDISSLDAFEDADFHFKIRKIDPQKRDDLSCLFRFYFMQPRKIVEKWLKISYI